MNREIVQRINERLKAVGLSAMKACETAGLSKDVIRNWRRSPELLPTAKSLMALAPVLKTSVNWLLYETDDEDGHSTPRGVRYGGIVEAGTFRKVDSMDQDAEYRIIPVAPDPRYPSASQFAFEVVGDSMNMAHIEEGMWLLAVQLNSFEKFEGDVPDQALVIAAIHRNGDPDREITVKRYRIFKDRIELRAESTNKTHEDRVYPHDQQSDTGILAVVLWAGWRLL